MEAADYVRMLLLEVKHPGVKLIDLDNHYAKGLPFALTNAKSLEATLNCDAGQPTDKRAKILVSQVRELLGENGYEDTEVRAHWCDTAQMITDVLAKLSCEQEPLLNPTGLWKLAPSEEASSEETADPRGKASTEE